MKFPFFVHWPPAQRSPSPHGEGGLKLIGEKLLGYNECPSPHGEGGLKLIGDKLLGYNECPSPHGEGGLKFSGIIATLPVKLSLPTRGGWIEMYVSDYLIALAGRVPPHTGRVD